MMNDWLNTATENLIISETTEDNNIELVKKNIVICISKNTNPSKSAKQHCNHNGKPLCNDTPKGKFNGWMEDTGEVTCEKCLKILERINND